MGHHHRDEFRPESQPVEFVEKSTHPFFEANDLTLLSLIVPLLSEQGKQLIAFFINYGNPKPYQNMIDPVNLLKQLAPKFENSPLKDFLPLILTFLAGSDKNRNFDPSVLASLFTNQNQKKEAE